MNSLKRIFAKIFEKKSTKQPKEIQSTKQRENEEIELARKKWVTLMEKRIENELAELSNESPTREDVEQAKKKYEELVRKALGIVR